MAAARKPLRTFVNISARQLDSDTDIVGDVGSAFAGFSGSEARDGLGARMGADLPKDVLEVRAYRGRGEE